MFDLTKALERIIDLAKKAEESGADCYSQSSRINLKDGIVAEYRFKVGMGLNRHQFDRGKGRKRLQITSPRDRGTS